MFHDYIVFFRNLRKETTEKDGLSRVNIYYLQIAFFLFVLFVIIPT